MEQSILNTTKKILGIDKADTAFDTDVIIHINSALATLTQLGVGPSTGFMIDDDVKLWADFMDNDPRLSPVKTYVYSYVKLQFDPPSTSYHLTARKEQLNELEWRLQVTADPVVSPVIP